MKTNIPDCLVESCDSALLDFLADRIENGNAVMCKEIFPDMTFEEAGGAVALMGCYARHMAFAVRHRWAGRIQTAQHHERLAENYYKVLPQWARW